MSTPDPLSREEGPPSDSPTWEKETLSVVATAWHQRLQCSGTDDFQLNAFVEQYVNQGPEKPPHNVKPQGRKPRT